MSTMICACAAWGPLRLKLGSPLAKMEIPQSIASIFALSALSLSVHVACKSPTHSDTAAEKRQISLLFC